jgi:hypothetical protein
MLFLLTASIGWDLWPWILPQHRGLDVPALKSCGLGLTTHNVAP